MHLTRCFMFRQVTVQYAAHASKVDKDAAWEDCRTLTHTWFSFSTQDCLSCDENLTRGLKQIRKLRFIREPVQNTWISSKATITSNKLHSQAVDTTSLAFTFVHIQRPYTYQRHSTGFTIHLGRCIGQTCPTSNAESRNTQAKEEVTSAQQEVVPPSCERIRTLLWDKKLKVETGFYLSYFGEPVSKEVLGCLPRLLCTIDEIALDDMTTSDINKRSSETEGLRHLVPQEVGKEDYTRMTYDLWIIALYQPLQRHAEVAFSVLHVTLESLKTYNVRFMSPLNTWAGHSLTTPVHSSTPTVYTSFFSSRVSWTRFCTLGRRLWIIFENYNRS